MSYAATHELRFKPRRSAVRLPYGLIVIGTVTAVVCYRFGMELRTTPEQRIEMQAVDAMLSHIQVVRVACPAPNLDQRLWQAYIARVGWPLYAPAGNGCVTPTMTLDYQGVINFQVACPTMVFNAADQQRWTSYAAAHNWAPFTQAGAACVDP